jgi:hypothetical protein
MLIPCAVLAIVTIVTVGKIAMDGTNGYRIAILLLSAAGAVAGFSLLITARAPGERRVQLADHRARAGRDRSRARPT